MYSELFDSKDKSEHELEWSSGSLGKPVWACIFVDDFFALFTPVEVPRSYAVTSLHVCLLRFTHWLESREGQRGAFIADWSMQWV